MTRLGIASVPIAFLLALAGGFSSRADTPATPPDFKEVYDLVREHLSGVTETELNRVAVQGLLLGLSPKVSLAEDSAAGKTNDSSLVTKSSLFEGPIGYIRISRVDGGLDKVLRTVWEELAATNKLNGVVIDLRYANGMDYAAAAAAADLFAKKEQPLMDWGQGMTRSKEKSDNLALPLAVLVNKQTAAAAETLAALLRQVSVGLILGNRTAGQAMISQEFPLKNGDRLRIATAPIQLGDGSSLSSEGVKPDITVEVAAADERAYFADSFKELPKAGLVATTGPSSGLQAGGTNRVRKTRFNEAELVRERRDGSVPDADASGAGGGDLERPAVRDPVLARGLDFLKGVSVIRQTRF